MGLKFWTTVASLLLMTSASAATLDQLVPQEDRALRCWQRLYSEQHLASHPDQQVTAVTFGVGFEPHEDPEPNDPGFSLFGMEVELRNGVSGRASGGCWIGEGDRITCGVDCDGGGVRVDPRDNGGLLVDLESTGSIRMEGECGEGDGSSTFSLQSGVDDKQFLLSEVERRVCKGLVPNW